MNPTLLNQYAIELQLEQERIMLNLTDEERLIRKAKLVSMSNGIKFPNINPQKMLRNFGKRVFQTRKVNDITLHTEVTNCSTC